MALRDQRAGAGPEATRQLAIEEQAETIRLVDIELGAGGPPTQQRVFYRDRKTRPVVVLGTSEHFEEGTKIPMLAGRFFNGTEVQYRTNVAVIGYTPYEVLFGASGTDPIGKTIRIGSPHASSGGCSGSVRASPRAMRVAVHSAAKASRMSSSATSFLR